ncbi:universal stress protein [Halovivax sp.]|uniref:universal stress protein n=1 Tax=Halovivax sp. TaxID=1935978 RepID=UPI0025C31599|nr:universal stress protein [Halovivax sp.]
MYDDILVPTDGSAAAGRAIDHAVAIADRFDATIHGLSVVVEGPYGAVDEASPERTAERALDHLVREVERTGVDVTRTVRQGIPDEEILAFADETGADLIVMGTVGRTGLDRVLLGSVTEHAVRNASVPVVTVREGQVRRIDTADEATSLAFEALRERGYENPEPVDDPHRTSGSWIVPATVDGGTVHVHVDAASGDARIAKID